MAENIGQTEKERGRFGGDLERKGSMGKDVSQTEKSSDVRHRDNYPSKEIGGGMERREGDVSKGDVGKEYKRDDDEFPSERNEERTK
jgi:hypothetical protein